jgi:NAD(P)H-flavin reductase
MTAPEDRVAAADDPLCPFPAVIRSLAAETPGVVTYQLAFEDPARQAAYGVAPGQFNMVYLPGVGEVPISVSSVSADGEPAGIGHTIRAVGRVTRALEALGEGRIVGLRGPYGSRWPIEPARGRDVVVVAGGLGLAPLRLAIRALLAERSAYGRLVLLYGARQPADLLYTAEYAAWQALGLEVVETVDRADASWTGRVGVVPTLFRKLKVDPARTVLFCCGPEIMMRFTAAEAIAAGVAEQDIHVSLERNMQCAVGLCGHCQLGPEFLCKDGPVFPLPRVARFFNQRNF